MTEAAQRYQNDRLDTSVGICRSADVIAARLQEQREAAHFKQQQKQLQEQQEHEKALRELKTELLHGPLTQMWVKAQQDAVGMKLQEEAAQQELEANIQVWQQQQHQQVMKHEPPMQQQQQRAMKHEPPMQQGLQQQAMKQEDAQHELQQHQELQQQQAKHEDAQQERLALKALVRYYV